MRPDKLAERVGIPALRPGQEVSSHADMAGQSTQLGGYAIVAADDLQAAVSMAERCPTITRGGGVEVGVLAALNVSATTRWPAPEHQGPATRRMQAAANQDSRPTRHGRIIGQTVRECPYVKSQNSQELGLIAMQGS